MNKDADMKFNNINILQFERCINGFPVVIAMDISYKTEKVACNMSIEIIWATLHFVIECKHLKMHVMKVSYKIMVEIV